MWEKKNIMVTGNFSFSHSVFYFSHNKDQFLGHIYFVVCYVFQFRLI